MKKNNASRLIIVSVFLLLMSLPATVSAEHPAQVIMGFYPNDYSRRDTIEPYIVSILALNEVANDRHLGEVKQFLEWYFSKLNNPDKHGLRGTIYVYVMKDGREVSTGKYDSVDGYAGMILHLLHQYAVKADDAKFLAANWQKIEEIAALIPLLQDDDGLTIAMKGMEVKYLMDNCESYTGLISYLAMRKLVGKGPSMEYSQAAVAVKQGILKHLFSGRKPLFAWALEDDDLSHSSWDVLYPDALAQLFPIYHDILLGKPEIKNRLWRDFNKHYKHKIAAFPVEQRIIYELTSAKMGGI